MFKLLRLVIIVFLATYFVGSLWWFLCLNFNTQEDIDNDFTFVRSNGFHEYFTPGSSKYCVSATCHLLHEATNHTTSIECHVDEWKKENCTRDHLSIVIIMMYYALTTLSTVGYGDIFPISTIE